MASRRPVLILDDDAELRSLLAERLDEDGAFVAAQADNIGEARAMLTAHGTHFDALILDVGLPDGDGRDLCAELRRYGFVMPILILTGSDGEADLVRGFDVGATDYVTKPVRAGELLARLRAQLRIFGRSEAAVLTVGPYRFCPGTKVLHEPVKNRRIQLTEKEAAVLKLLYRADGEAVPRQVLLNEVWGYNAAVRTHTVETHIYRLRQKMAPDPSSTRGLIVTEGTGYRLNAAPMTTTA